MKVKVRTVSGKTDEFEVADGDNVTVKDMKRAYCALLDADPESSIRLVFGGKVLDDSATISSYNIKEGSVALLVGAAPQKAAKAEAPASAPEKKGDSASSTSAATAADEFPPGAVHHITQGATQLRKALDEGKRRGQLVVVDWSATWCGPCRNVAPLIAKMAQDTSDVAFVLIETDSTQENTSLARQAQITAYPTFQIYHNNALAGEVKGASPPKLEAEIARIKSTMGASGGAVAAVGGSGDASGSGGGGMTDEVFRALVKLKEGCGASTGDFNKAVKALVKFAGNVVENPSEQKFRSIKVNHPPFQRILGSKPGAMEVLKALGFREEDRDGEPFLHMVDVPSDLGVTHKKLKEALDASLGAGSSSSTTSPSVAAAAPASSTTPTAGATGAASAQQTAQPAWQQPGFPQPPLGPNGMPDMNAMRQQVLNNPQLINQMMQDPMVQRMMQDPQAMAQAMQLARQMGGGEGMPPMPSPEEMQRMLQMMGGGGMGGGGGGFGSPFGGGAAPATPNFANQGTAANPNQPPPSTPPGSGAGFPGQFPFFGNPGGGGGAMGGGGLNGDLSEEAALQEAIRLSMMDQGGSGGGGGGGGNDDDQGNNGGADGDRPADQA